MNTISFQDLVKGQYGRRIAYADYEEVTPDNAVAIVSVGVTTLNANRPAIRYLWDYYKGDQPIRYRQKMVRSDIVNKIVENHAYEWVQFKVGQSYGEPIQCISRSDDDKVNEYVDKLNDYLKDSNKQTRDITCGEWQSATGTGYKAVFDRKIDNAEVPFGIIVPTPLNTVIVYSSITQEPLLSIQNIKDADGQNAYRCYTDSAQFIVKNSKLVEWNLHAFGSNPIVEYPNNSNRISDIELVCDILDAINSWQSDRLDSADQFIQSFMKFVNCEVDEVSFKRMKEMGAIVVKSNNGENKADVDIMSQELNQTESQVAKDDLLDNAERILAIPGRNQGSDGGSTQGAVQLRSGWDFSKSRAKLKDPLIIESEKKLIRVILEIIRIRKGDADCPLKNSEFDVQINHSPTDNMMVKTQALEFLLRNGIHPLEAIKTVGLWGDAEKVFLLSKPYLDKLWKREDGFDVEEQTKKANLFMQLMNAGYSIEEAGEKSGLVVEKVTENFKKWDYVSE